MKYKPFAEILSIKGNHNWLIDDHHIYINNNSDKTLYIYDSTMQVVDHMPFGGCSGIRKIGTQFYTQQKVNGTSYFSHISFESKSIEPCIYKGVNYGINDLVVEDTCIGFFNKDTENYVGIWDLKLSTFIWANPIDIGGFSVLNDHFFIYQNKKNQWNASILTTLERLTGDLIWEMDFSTFGSIEEQVCVKRIIGIFNGLLLVVIGGSKQTIGESQLIALEVATGQTRWHLHKITDNIGQYIPGLYSMTTNEEGTRLYGLENSSFIEIDVATGEVLRYRNLGGKNAYTMHYQNYKLGIKNINYYQGHLYFTAFVQGYSLASCLL